MNAIHDQSADINQGVDRGTPEDQGAGDQGMMFGYATNETLNFMPLALEISHRILRELAALRRESDSIQYLRPDAKSQVTIQYGDENRPERIEAIVVSTQHDDFASDEAMLAQIRQDIIKILIPRVKNSFGEATQKLFGEDIKFHINPTGKFVIGGPHGDSGLTGRKIIVDTYGGKGAHGGGAFSGKDPSKVDRSAAYAMRHIAKNMVAAGISDQMLVQVSYAIGVAKPMGVFVDTYGTAKVNMTDGQIAENVLKIFDLRPGIIERDLKLRNPIYSETAAYGHMGRTPEKVVKHFHALNGTVKEMTVELFTWEKLDKLEEIKKTFGL